MLAPCLTVLPEFHFLQKMPNGKLEKKLKYTLPNLPSPNCSIQSPRVPPWSMRIKKITIGKAALAVLAFRGHAPKPWPKPWPLKVHSI